MWILVVLQIMSGSATAKSSLPINYSGVVMQEFKSKESCERAAKLLAEMAKISGAGDVAYRNGIISAQCIEK
jgi:hypothetical protein